MIRAAVGLFSTRCPHCRSIDFTSVGARNTLEMAFQWLLQPHTALFAAAAFSCSDGMLSSGALRKTGRAVDAPTRVPSVATLTKPG
jgi:hypothetical protein